MKKRNKLTRKGSKRLFSATAVKVNKKNNLKSPVVASAMRGGIRL